MEIQITDNGVVLATITLGDGAKVETGAKAPAKTKVEAKASKKTEAKASGKTKAERSSENKTRYAKVNAYIGVASRASDPAKQTEALASAMKFATEPTVWTKDVNRILSKAEDLGLSLS